MGEYVFSSFRRQSVKFIHPIFFFCLSAQGIRRPSAQFQATPSPPLLQITFIPPHDPFVTSFSFMATFHPTHVVTNPWSSAPLRGQKCFLSQEDSATYIILNPHLLHFWLSLSRLPSSAVRLQASPPSVPKILTYLPFLVGSLFFKEEEVPALLFVV